MLFLASDLKVNKVQNYSCNMRPSHHIHAAGAAQEAAPLSNVAEDSSNTGAEGSRQHDTLGEVKGGDRGEENFNDIDDDLTTDAHIRKTSSESEDRQAMLSRDEEVSINTSDQLIPGTGDVGVNSGAPRGASGRFTIWSAMAVSAFWLGYSVFWLLILVNIMPAQIKDIVGDDYKGTGVSIAVAVSGVVNLFIAPIYGALNDRMSSKWGKRSPSMFIGTIASCAAMFLMWPSDSFWFYVFAYTALTVGTVISSSPFYGLVADVTPPEATRIVSAMNGALGLIGNLLGAILGLVTMPIYLLYIIITIISVATLLITLMNFREKRDLERPPPFRLVPFLIETVSPLWEYRDFRLVFLSRFFFQLGIATFQQYIQYWLDDCVPIPDGMNAQSAVSLVLIPLLLVSPISAAILLFPCFGDRRKIVVYGSALFMIVASLMIILDLQSFPFAFLVSTFFGMGYGPFISIEFAMLIDVLPSGEAAAKDMSLWHSAFILPQLTATPLAGLLRDQLQLVGRDNGLHCLGYKVVVGLIILYLVLGCIITIFIRKIK